MFVYENHLGGLYCTDYEQDWDDLYCEQCGDSDDYIGCFDSAKDVLAYMADDIDVDNSGGWILEMLLEDLKSFDDVPSLAEAEDIVRKNKSQEDEEDDD